MEFAVAVDQPLQADLAGGTTQIDQEEYTMNKTELVETIAQRTDIAMKDVQAVGILSASPGLAGAIDLYASGAVDPRPLVAATVGLEDVDAVLRGSRPDDAGPGPKIHVNPRARRDHE